MTPFHVYLYGRAGGPITASFEEAADRLQQIPKLYFEPDGSFVWSCGDAAQIDGMIYDAGGSIQYVDLQGRCRRSHWRQLLAAIDPNLSRDAVLLCLPERRRQTLQEFEDFSIDAGGNDRC